jgi:hypothetical protein
MSLNTRRTLSFPRVFLAKRSGGVTHSNVIPVVRLDLDKHRECWSRPGGWVLSRVIFLKTELSSRPKLGKTAMITLLVCSMVVW